MDVPSVGEKDASSAGHWVESLAVEKDVRTVVVSVDSKVAKRVAWTVASWVVWTGATGVATMVASMVVT